MDNRTIRRRKSYNGWYTLISWLTVQKPTPRAITKALYNTLRKADCLRNVDKEWECLQLALRDLEEVKK